MRKGRNRWVAFGWVSRKAKGVACRRVHYRKWMMVGGMERKLRGKMGVAYTVKLGVCFCAVDGNGTRLKTNYPAKYQSVDNFVS